jgi:hypothetical protein
VEIVAALTRQARASRLSLPDATAAIAAFKNHLATRYRVVLTVPAVVQLIDPNQYLHGSPDDLAP